MSSIPLRPVSWKYDEETNRVVAGFVDEAPSGHPDPASYEPTISLSVEFVPSVVEQDVSNNVA